MVLALRGVIKIKKNKITLNIIINNDLLYILNLKNVLHFIIYNEKK